VCVDRSKGLRPHVNYLYARYSSAQLGKDYGMVGKTLLLRPDMRNLRTVMLFREDGTLYGPVQVLGRWGTFPHDQRLRRLFGRLKRAGELDERADDLPLEALFAHLRAKAQRDRKAALQLTYLVEYLMRNAVPLSPQLTQGVWDWNQLRQVAANVTVLPVRSAPPSTHTHLPTQVASVPASAKTRPAPSPQPVRVVPNLAGRSGTPGFRPRPNISR
jgi:putative transposase